MHRPHQNSRSAGLVLVVCLALPVAAFCQSRLLDGDTFPVKQSSQHNSSLEALQTFERMAPPSYVIGEGDELFVEVFAHPELSGKRIVGPDGQITLPVVGGIPLADLSRENARLKVDQAYAQYYTGLSVELRIEVYASNRIFVLGRVASPGVLHFDSTPTLLEAIARAGSLPVGGIGADKAALNRCVIVRGREAVVWVDLRPLLKEGNLAYNLRLQPNDVLYIPDSDDQSIYVLGEVEHPGAYRLRPDMTFMEAYSEAGGSTKDGVPDHIQLIRPSKGAKREVAMRDVMRPSLNLNLTLLDGDIIYVPRRGLAKFGYFMAQFGPASGVAIVGKQIAP